MISITLEQKRAKIRIVIAVLFVIREKWQKKKKTPPKYTLMGDFLKSRKCLKAVQRKNQIHIY